MLGWHSVRLILSSLELRYWSPPFYTFAGHHARWRAWFTAGPRHGRIHPSRSGQPDRGDQPMSRSVLAFLAIVLTCPAVGGELPGLLFHLSFDRQTVTADFAAGEGRAPSIANPPGWKFVPGVKATCIRSATRPSSTTSTSVPAPRPRPPGEPADRSIFSAGSAGPTSSPPGIRQLHDLSHRRLAEQGVGRPPGADGL
jgi:hypothetical protein